MYRLISFSSVLAISASGAFAQDITYADVGIEYNYFTDGSSDLSTTLLSGGVGLSYGQIDVALEVNQIRLASSGPSLDRSNLLVEGAYNISPELAVGLAFATTNLPVDANEVQVFVRYDNDQFFGELGVGRFFEPGNFDNGVDTWSATAGYDLGQGTQVSATYADLDGMESFTALNVTHDAGPLGVDLDLYSIEDVLVYGFDGSYEVSSQIDALVHVSGTNESTTLAAVGAQYNLNSDFGIYGLVGVLTDGSSDARYLGIGLNYAIGPGSANPMTGTPVNDIYGPLFVEARYPFSF